MNRKVEKNAASEVDTALLLSMKQKTVHLRL